jgi:hypothetical protein
MTLGFTQHRTEMSTRIFYGGKAQPARKADVIVINVPTV